MIKDDHLYDKFNVRCKFRERIYGGIPKSKELIDNYVSSKFGVENSDLAKQLKKEVDLDEELEKISCGFKQDQGQPYISDYQVKAMLKQAASRLKITTKKRGSKQDITDGLWVSRRIFFHNGEGTIKGPLRTEEFCGHVTGPRGKRSILKASEFIEGAEISITIRLLKVAILSGKNLKDCFLLGQEIGLGSNRSFEAGKYDLLEFEKEKN